MKAHTHTPRLIAALTIAFAGPVACGASPDETPRASVRGQRTCELYELAIEGDDLTLVAWSDGGLHDCPDAWLAAIDRGRYAVGGPRWRSIDEIVAVDANGDPVEPTDRIIEEVPAGLGQQMQLAATVALVPIATLEQQLGVTITTLDDIPAPARESLLSGTLRGEEYRVAEVQRALMTRMTHFAGASVYTLYDGQCTYAMKFYTNIIDPTLDNEEAVAQLGSELTLPEGFTFTVRTFDEDLVITETDGTAQVIADELGNSYDRFACD